LDRIGNNICQEIIKPIKTNVYNTWKKWMKNVSGSVSNVEQQMFEIKDKTTEKFYSLNPEHTNILINNVRDCELE
jgi:hypothetical protein